MSQKWETSKILQIQLAVFHFTALLLLGGNNLL